jgi:hypothetical protein
MFCAAAGAAGLSDADLDAVFALRGEDCIMEEEHFGIVSGQLTTGINHRDVGSVAGLWAPPYVSSDFLIEMQVGGEKVPTREYTWRPMEVRRTGGTGDVEVSSTTTLVPGTRAGILTLDLESRTPAPQDVDLRFVVKGTLDRTDVWEFSRAQSATPAPAKVEENHLVKEQGPQAVVLRADLEGLQWDVDTSAWKTTLALAPHEKRTIHVVFAIGEKSASVAQCDALAADPAKAVADAGVEYRRRVNDLFDKLPVFTSSNPSLVKFYNRSLVHFLMNRWDVPEFVLHPYYSTGSVKGGCVCNYLWNFGEVWEILPLYDPQAAREHIKQFLKTDITTHFAFMPVNGEAFGPWYPVNQEKIIGLIYYYVQITGDTAFLGEAVADKNVLDWAVYHAMHGDDLGKPVALIDYGPSNSHLELRRGYPYNHVMPDLNGRRYANYLRAAELCEVAGRPARYLVERAEALKVLLKQRLWNPDTKWFWFENDQGVKDTRLTVQLFKLFGSGVLDNDEAAGLLSHLNETEFLSEYGLHSMSKTDIAYDQVDIDNGGGGICTCFTPQIAERLYKSGHADLAADLFRRTLWWGERMPYWGDSLVANSIDYRKDTPLQCTLDGVAVAQCILFGMFGVNVELNGDITVDPHPPGFAPRMKLEGLRLRGMEMDIEVDGDHFGVECNGRTILSRIGTPVSLRNGGALGAL